MKRNIFFLFFLIFFTNCFALQNKNNFVDISSSVGVMFGRASEYVYLDYENFQGIENYNEKLSQLDYDYAVPCLNLKIESRLFKYLHLGFDISTAIPMKCGIMQDYDWLNKEYPSHQWANELTNYSKHENYLDSYFDCKLNIGPNINILNKVSLIPLVGFGLDSIQFSASNGKCKYGVVKDGAYTPISLENEEFELSGKDIIYSQYSSAVNGGSLIQFNLGLKYSLDFIPRIKILGSFLFYPFYTISSYDYHIRTNTEYISVVEHSFKFSTDLQVSFKINSFLFAGVFGQFDIVPQLRGVSYSKYASYNGAYSFANNCQSGIERISGKVSLVFGLSF